MFGFEFLTVIKHYLNFDNYTKVIVIISFPIIFIDAQ